MVLLILLILLDPLDPHRQRGLVVLRNSPLLMLTKVPGQVVWHEQSVLSRFSPIVACIARIPDRTRLTRLHRAVRPMHLGRGRVRAK